MSLCPTGHFCPLGTSEPFPCGKASVCPAGSEREFVLDGFVCLMVVDFILVVYCLVTAFPAIWWRCETLLSKFTRSANARRELDAQDLEDLNAVKIKDTSVDLSDESHAIRNFVESVKTSVGPDNVGLAIRFENVSLSIRGGKSILGPQSGLLEKGSLWGFMGPSGAGKSQYKSHTLNTSLAISLTLLQPPLSIF